MTCPRAATVVVLSAVAAAAPAAAHPAVDVVIDSRGNVYYSDLKQVWMLAPDGTHTVAVPGVHTHELFVDADDTLFGEHLWYEGEATDRWGHRVWKRTRDGVISEVVPPTAGFRTEYSFDRDGAGNHYFACTAEGTMGRDRTEVRRRAPDGTVAVVARGFRSIGWMHASPDGTVLLIDRPAVKRITPGGRVTTLVADANRRVLPALADERHDLMGVWPGRSGEVFVARSRTREVLRIAPDGAVSTVSVSPVGWAPSGGIVAADGTQWVLEYSTANSFRVRRITVGGAQRTFP